MKLRALSVALLLAAPAVFAFAHAGGHPKTTVEECKKLLDAELQKECIACVTPGKKHFHNDAKGAARCMDDEAAPAPKK